ncbi:hypothetical protein COD11_00720 [Bacillus sp. AFS040349]|nr:hypothetical protein COD11_00720 [Bacillus sp. AFS040349]
MKTKPQIEPVADGHHKRNEDQNPNRIPPRWSSKAWMMKPTPIEPPQTFFRTPNQSKYKKSNIHKEEKIP